MADISEAIEGVQVDRPQLEHAAKTKLDTFRLVSISGLPGCGKSAVLKRIASAAAEHGPILFIKSDRLTGSSWQTFATGLGLRHFGIADILTELGATGSPILFIDGIDRVKPNQKNVILDVIRAIESDENLSNWRILATSRDQGLEAYRAWVPSSFYRASGMGNVQVKEFTDEEAERLASHKPPLRRLLFGPPAVREIARRPFFADVLARNFLDDGTPTPQTEIDLITAWWSRAGHNTDTELVPQRQHALIDFAEKGVSNLGKGIPTRTLSDASISHIAALKADHIIRDHDGGASHSFTHDIFFEWTFFRLLIELGDDWTTKLVEAGEPPLLGRVIGLLAQNAMTTTGKWSKQYQKLEAASLRPQWRREWLTAPPFTPSFIVGHTEFEGVLAENDYALLEKLLVWFQAVHTVPNPLVLQNAQIAVEEVDRVRLADTLGWPSDFASWGRLLDWLIPLVPKLPARLLANVIEVFGVWQNAVGHLKNPRSEAIIKICEACLIELEIVEYPEEMTFDHGRWNVLNSEARSSFLSALRALIVRSARTYSEPAKELYRRAASNERMRREAYADLMMSAALMAPIDAEAIIAVTKAEVMEELPLDRIKREEEEYRRRLEFVDSVRAIPEAQRTEDQRRALSHAYFPIGRDRVDLDDIGIVRYSDFYQPASALDEPFPSLFAVNPQAALGLVRDLANHAIEGWRQVHQIERRHMGTPIAVTVEFPWGTQTFWGDWHVYSWGMGELAPGPLESAFLALNYWAFKEIERGRSTDAVIQDIVEGHQCYAVLGIALRLALETFAVSNVTLPLLTCQRLWHHDFARLAHEPTRNIDLFGLGFLSRLKGDKQKAKEFLDARESRKRNVRDLAIRFAISADVDLRDRCKEALKRFPDDLPYQLEETRSNNERTASLKESAELWAGLGDAANYRAQPVENDQLLVTYEPPVPRTQAQEKRLQETTTSLQEYQVVHWASKSLETNTPAEGLTLANATHFARSRDKPHLLNERDDEGGHTPQSVLAIVAACIVRFGPSSGSDYDWAWQILARVATMKEPENLFPGAKVPWHPSSYLVLALAHDRKLGTPRQDSAARLLQLALHPLEEISQLAFAALLHDPNDRLRWIAAQLAMDLSLYYAPEISERGERDRSAGNAGRQASLARALNCLAQKDNDHNMTPVPSAWTRIEEPARPTRRRSRRVTEGGYWGDPDPSFNATQAAHIFRYFPIEEWCRSELSRPRLEALLKELVRWTAEKLMPSWTDRRHDRDHTAAGLFEWRHALAGLLARAAPFFDTDFVRNEWLKPFLVSDEKALGVLAEFAHITVVRHVFDAAEIPANTFELLGDCATRAIADRSFEPDGSRAGQVYGQDMPRLLQALFFIGAENAPGAARFANGDWTEIAITMPTVSRLMASIGWSPYVMEQFLLLCERAAGAYPISDFAEQTNGALTQIVKAKGGWVGTTLAARLASVIQRLADANFPLARDQAHVLLRVLDTLIDLGDRRSAALEQTEAFRGVRLT